MYVIWSGPSLASMISWSLYCALQCIVCDKVVGSVFPISEKLCKCSPFVVSVFQIFIRWPEEYTGGRILLKTTKSKLFVTPHVRTGPESISTAVVSGFHTQAHYGRRDSSAAQVGWSCSAQHQASQHQHSAELSCKLSAEWLLFFTLYKCSGVGDSWGAWWSLIFLMIVHLLYCVILLSIIIIT